MCAFLPVPPTEKAAAPSGRGGRLSARTRQAQEGEVYLPVLGRDRAGIGQEKVVALGAGKMKCAEPTALEPVAVVAK